MRNSKIELVEKSFLKQDLPKFNVGDTVKVYVTIKEEDKTRLQAFEGIVMRERGSGVQKTFTVRRISYGEGVERTFPLNSPSVEKVDVLKIASECFFRCQDAARNLSLLNKLVALVPEDGVAWFRMGGSLEDLSRPEEAIQCYDRVLELDPNSISALSNKAGVLRGLKRDGEALKCFDRALEIDGKNAMVWRNKGGQLIEMKRFREAIAALEEAKRLGASEGATAF